jgi:hypothetical protein
VAVEEEISEELSEETWLSEKAIEKAIEETIMESNEIVETMQEAIEEHQADVEDAVKEANVPFPSCGQGGARTWADVTDATLADLVADLVADDESVTAGGAQSSVALTAPVPASFWLEATTEAILADLVAGEEAIGLHDISPAQATETATGLTMAHPEHVTIAGIQQADPEWLRALNRKLDDDGTGR